MTARKRKTKGSDAATQTPLEIAQHEHETGRQAVARKFTSPHVRHGIVAADICNALSSGLSEANKPSLVEYANEIKARGDKAAQGDLELASQLLASQAITLDSIFTEMARRMAHNMGEYLGATDTYARIALKAQAGSRATIEALAKLHSPREQTVRHVHVSEGGQAVIADQFHNHTGGQKNGQTSKQPHAPEIGAAGPSPALPSPDPLGAAVPLASGEGKSAVPNARRQGQRGA
jgi:hypothetical protein